MTRTLTRFSLICVFALSLLVVGCANDGDSVLGAGADDISGTESLETLDLDAEYGGLAYTDEVEGFGDEDLITAAMVEDAAALSEDEEDSLVDDDPTLTRPEIQRTYVRILWGMLDGEFDRDFDRSVDAVLDWSGSVTVSEGVVALKRTILFERPFDHRLPRETRDSLGWVSHTGPHFDGVLVALLTPMVDGVPVGEFTIETPQFRTTLSIASLNGYEELTAVDDLGNAVSIRAEFFDPHYCAAGFLGGFWKNGEDNPETDAIELGGFRGRFVGQNGMGAGYLMGRYGINSEGERVMAGKFIGQNGHVRGLIHGIWTPSEDGRGMGTFQARWATRNGTHMGTLEGVYRQNEDDQRGDGFFEGRYRENCDSAS